MTLNLTGINYINELNLTGKPEYQQMKPSSKINAIKKHILSNYLVPLYTEQWSTLSNNKLLIDGIIGQLNHQYKMYKIEELNLFIQLLNVIKFAIEKNDLLTDYEDKNRRLYDKNHVINMVYKTTKIQILPEYEIYNCVIGKPNRGEKYNDAIIEEIKTLLKRENITFNKISDHIKGKN